LRPNLHGGPDQSLEINSSKNPAHKFIRNSVLLPPSMRGVAYTGVLLSFAGAALDVSSGYTLASVAADAMMGGGPSTEYMIFLYGLAAALAVAGLTILMPGASGRMRLLGLVMVLFGVIMVLAGAFVPGMNAALSAGMLIVGVLMSLNGALMQRNKKGAMDRPAKVQ
jgi:hypothetical protein